MKMLKNIALAAMILVIAGSPIFAQDTGQSAIENDFEYRTYVKLSYKLLKNLKLNLSPEVRFEDDFSIDQYLIETQLVYRPVKILYLTAGYRFTINERSEKATEYLNRYELGAALKKKFNRFTPELKLRYTNYTDDDASTNVLRYKAALEYNIKGFKLTPTLSAELFQQVAGNGLYKVRYKLGLDYKLFKNNYLEASYRLDYYLKEYKNNNIFSVGYKIKL
jgi:hypothetical protein